MRALARWVPPLAAMAVFVPLAASASEDLNLMNEAIGGRTTDGAGGSQAAPAPPPTAPLPSVAAPATPSAGALPNGASCDVAPCGPGALAAHESFPVTNEPLSALRIISSRPFADGGTCQSALFEAEPLVSVRAEAVAGGRLELPLADLCMIEFRNDAPSKVLTVRLDQRAAALTITTAPALYSGLELSPNQSVALPLRQLSIDGMDLLVEVIWAEETDPQAAQSFTIALTP